MKQQSILYCIDVAEKMLDILELKFQNSDFCKNPDNYFKRITQKEVDNLEKISQLEEESKINESGGKTVFALESDVEQLPFPGLYFDSFCANLALQITPNHMQMLKEAYRVLKEGGKAAFSVWGSEENNSLITLVPSIIEKYGATEKPVKYVEFHLNNQQDLIDKAKEVGFSYAKVYEQPNYLTIKDGQEYLSSILDSSQNVYFEGFDSETVEKIKQDIITEFDERFGVNTNEMLNFAAHILVCIK